MKQILDFPVSNFFSGIADASEEKIDDDATHHKLLSSHVQPIQAQSNHVEKSLLKVLIGNKAYRIPK